MYIPAHFQATESQVLHEIVRNSPLGTFVIHKEDGFLINHIPFTMVERNGELTGLQAHVPRANPVSEYLVNGADCVVVFQQADGYVSPSWYATKREHGKVVPTWNYAVAHVHGVARAIDDIKWIQRQIQKLTNQNEQDRADPWAVSDAPKSYIEQLTKSLVGIEVDVQRLEGKFKCSQNQPQKNKDSLLDALNKSQVDPAFSSVMRSQLTNNAPDQET